MPLEHGRELTAYLEERFGPTLRSVLYYEYGDHEILYAREGIREQYSAGQIEDIVGYLSHESVGKEASERRYPHGDILCELEIYEHAVELNFIFGKGEGVAVGIDPHAFVGSRTFIDECLDILSLDDEIEDEIHERVDETDDRGLD